MLPDGRRATLAAAPSGGPCRRARAPPPDRRAGGAGAAGGWGAHGVPAHRARPPARRSPNCAGSRAAGWRRAHGDCMCSPRSPRATRDAAAGIAIAQEPAAGTHVADGSTVRVVLSKGPPPVVVPSVVGKPSAFAERLLASAGLHYGVTFVAGAGIQAECGDGTVARFGRHRVARLDGGAQRLRRPRAGGP